MKKDETAKTNTIFIAKLLSLIILSPIIYFGIIHLVVVSLIDTVLQSYIWISLILLINIAPPAIWSVIFYVFSKKNKEKIKIIFNSILAASISMSALVVLNWLFMPAWLFMSLWFEIFPLLQSIMFFLTFFGPIVVVSYFVGLLIAIFYKNKRKNT